MDATNALKTAEELIQPWAKVVTHPDPLRMDVVILPRDLKETVRALRDTRWGYLAAITGLDRPEGTAPASEEKAWAQTASTPEQSEDHHSQVKQGEVEVLYHFCQKAAVLTLRVSVPYTKAVLPTVCDLIPAATLYERELMELLGVRIEGTPNSSKLVLPDDWPDGIYPLRKSFTGFETEPAGKEG